MDGQSEQNLSRGKAKAVKAVCCLSKLYSIWMWEDGISALLSRIRLITGVTRRSLKPKARQTTGTEVSNIGTCQRRSAQYSEEGSQLVCTG